MAEEIEKRVAETGDLLNWWDEVIRPRVERYLAVSEESLQRAEASGDPGKIDDCTQEVRYARVAHRVMAHNVVSLGGEDPNQLRLSI